MFGQSSHTNCQVRPKFGKNMPIVGQIWRRCCRSRPDFAKFGPSLAKVGPNLAKFDQYLTDVWPSFGRMLQAACENWSGDAPGSCQVILEYVRGACPTTGAADLELSETSWFLSGTSPACASIAIECVSVFFEVPKVVATVFPDEESVCTKTLVLLPNPVSRKHD